MSDIHLLTSSRLKSLQTCGRAHFYRYELGLTANAPDSPALLFGTAIHAGLESWWRCYQELCTGAYGYALSSALVAADAAYPSDDPFASAMLRALLTAYDARWGEWAATVEVLGVEVPFSYELTHPVTGQAARTWRVAGKIDALVRLSDGRVAVLEHKSRSGDAAAGGEYRRALTLDPQVSTYFDGAAALGHDADLCLYDVLCKPATKPLLATPTEDRIYTAPKSRACKACKKKTPPPMPHAEDGIECVDGRIVTDVGGRLHARQRDRDETAVEYERRLIEAIAADPDRYLVHAEIHRSDDERVNHAWALWHNVRSIEETRTAVRKASGDVRAVPQNPGGCFKWGSACQFLPLCEGTANAADEHAYRRLPTVHPELAEETHDISDAAE